VRPCNGCGKCCEKYGHSLQANQRDVDRWRSDRPDILRYMDPLLGDLWLNPQTGEEVQRCPWLRKMPREQRFKCRIYELRPDVCRDYPVNVQQMIDDGCEMLEPEDIGKSVEVLTRELEALRAMPS
jgi:uncharacterized protein